MSAVMLLSWHVILTKNRQPSTGTGYEPELNANRLRKQKQKNEKGKETKQKRKKYVETIMQTQARDYECVIVISFCWCCRLFLENLCIFQWNLYVCLLSFDFTV